METKGKKGRSVILRAVIVLIIAAVLSVLSAGCENKLMEIIARDLAAGQPPISPSELHAQAVSVSQIDLSWSDNSDNETEFQIQRRISSSEDWQTESVGQDSTTYSDKELDPETEYIYRMRAVNADSESDWTEEVSAATLSLATLIPDPPSELIATTISSTQIDLTWTDNSDNEEEFQIQRDSGSGFQGIATVGADSTAYSDQGLTPDTYYTYQVRAANDAGESAWSNEDTATTDLTEAFPPAAPSNLTATAQNGDQIELTWNDNSNNEEAFEVQRKIGPSGMYFTISDTIAAGATEFIDTGLESETLYYYHIRATNTAGESDWSAQANETTLMLATPTNLQATAVSKSQIDLNWVDNSFEEYFEIERNGSVIDSNIPANSESYSDTGLSSGTNYTYKIRATDPGGQSAWSSEASTSTVYAIGDSGPAGGVVFYDKGSVSNGWRYLEAATSDQGTASVWGGSGRVDIGSADSWSAPELTGIGSGMANTAAIVAAFGDAEPEWFLSDYAAKLCHDLSIENGGTTYDDWFLPSKDEFDEMYDNKGVIGGFSEEHYWSSSEIDYIYAWRFENGSPYSYFKTSDVGVRAVRTFRSFNPSYVVTYISNKPDLGLPPVGPTFYETGETVTVQGNTGNLDRAGFGFSFVGWNTEPDGSGTHYDPGNTFVMGSESVVLYAEWQADLGFDPIGDAGPGGGVVFYDKGFYSNGWRYLEAATSDEGNDRPWGGYGIDIGGDDSGSAPELEDIGTGKANTEAIVQEFGDEEPYENTMYYAAKLCYDRHDQGYYDWFLPSEDELERMYDNRASIGGFASDKYWSSTENTGFAAREWDFSNDLGGSYTKNSKLQVRAIRRF